MSIDTLEKLFYNELKDVYSAEKQILAALPKMIAAATSKELKAAFTAHQKVTETHVKRLDKVFALIGKAPQAKHCKGMAGLLEEGAGVIEEKMDPLMKDAALIGAARRVEHYEIAAYSTLQLLAASLDDTKSADHLEETLDEETSADELLASLAEKAMSEEAGSR